MTATTAQAKTQVGLVLAALAVLTSAARADPPPLLDKAQVELTPHDPFPYVEPGSTTPVRYRITNHDAAALRLTWRVTVKAPRREPVTLEETFTLEPKARRELTMPAGLSAVRGVVQFDWSIQDAQGRRLALTDRLGVMTLPGPDARHRERFRYGWGTALVHFVDSPDDVAAMPAYAAMGCDLIRVGDRWAFTSPREANYFTGRYAHTDRIIDAAAAHQLDVLYVLWGTPEHLVQPGFSHQEKLEQLASDSKTKVENVRRTAPPQPQAWRQRVRQTVTRFHHHVRYWEVWNDQDRYAELNHHMPNGWVGNTQEYLDLLRDAHRAIKGIDPNLRVLTGGFYSLHEGAMHRLNPGMQARVLAEATEAFDIHASFEASPGVLLGPMRRLREPIADAKPLWITRAEQKGAQADELVRRLVAAQASGARAFVWMWALNFDSGDRGFLMPMATWKTKDRQALNRHSVFQVLEPGCAYVHAIGLLRDYVPEGWIDTGDAGRWVFAFRHADDPRRTLLAFWRSDAAFDADLPRPVPRGAACSLIDLYGNAQPLAANDRGEVTLPIRATPAYLLITASR